MFPDHVDDGVETLLDDCVVGTVFFTESFELHQGDDDAAEGCYRGGENCGKTGIMSHCLLEIKPCLYGWWHIVACCVAQMPWFFWYDFP